MAAGPPNAKQVRTPASPYSDLPDEPPIDRELLRVVHRAWDELKKTGELTVRANRFLLVGDNGTVRAVMSSHKDDVMLSMYDAAGNLRLKIGVFAGGPSALDMYTAGDTAAAPVVATDANSRGGANGNGHDVRNGNCNGGGSSNGSGNSNDGDVKIGRKKNSMPRISLACVPGQAGDSPPIPMLQLWDTTSHTQVALAAEPSGASWLVFHENGGEIPVATFLSEWGVVRPPTSGWRTLEGSSNLRDLCQAEKVLRLIRLSCDARPERALVALDLVYPGLVL
jgi:hypothetical protein